MRPHTSRVVLWSDTQHQFWMDREVWVRVESPLTPGTDYKNTGQTVGRSRKEQPVTPGLAS